jgi:hypothetical protein
MINKRSLVFLVMVVCWGAAHAIQPVEVGLQPLLDRQQAIVSQQQAMNVVLQSPESAPEDRALAYRAYKEFEEERLQLSCEIEQGRRLATSPLVSYTVPPVEMACRAAPKASSGEVSAAPAGLVR